MIAIHRIFGGRIRSGADNQATPGMLFQMSHARHKMPRFAHNPTNRQQGGQNRGECFVCRLGHLLKPGGGMRGRA